MGGGGDGDVAGACGRAGRGGVSVLVYLLEVRVGVLMRRLCRAAADHPYHVSQLHIILDQTDTLLESFASGLQEGLYVSAPE